jgi:hypothetical protein
MVELGLTREEAKYIDKKFGQYNFTLELPLGQVLRKEILGDCVKALRQVNGDAKNWSPPEKDFDSVTQVSF